MYKCPKCERSFEGLDSIRIHWNKLHHSNSRELHLLLFLNGIEPLCACGCGKVPRFLSLQVGYSKYIPGHQARVHNNWGHNVAAREKSQASRRESIANGEWEPWNKGETKDTHESVAAYGRSGSETIKNKPGELERRSERLRKHRLDGTVRTLYGSEHSQWRGGVSALQALVRASLNRAWTFPIMKRDGFKCTACGSTRDLCVHHDVEHFSPILRKAVAVLGEPGDDFAAKDAITKWVVAYHIDNNVSGVTLCYQCHNDAHGIE